MRRIIVYILCFVVLCFILPIIFTKRPQTVKMSNPTLAEENQEKKEEKSEPYTYKNYANVKLLHSKTGEVQELNMDEYLYGVVSAEMPANYEIEALKAQAIVARTYTAYKISKNNY